MGIGLTATCLEPAHHKQRGKDRRHQLTEDGAHRSMRAEKSRIPEPIHRYVLCPREAFRPWTTAVFSSSSSETNPASFIRRIASAILKHDPCWVLTRICTAN